VETERYPFVVVVTDEKTGQEEEVCLVVEMRRVTAERKGFKKSRETLKVCTRV